MSNLPQKPSEEELRTETQIQELLDKVRSHKTKEPNLWDHLTLSPQRDALIAQLTRLLDSESALTASALKQNNLSRHREVLQDHKRELKRLRSSISESRDRQHLLSNVRSDIDAYRSNSSNNPAEAEAEYMLQERGRLDNSHNVMDSVLSQAYAVNESFVMQRETLASINRRIVGAASQVPGINGLINRIGAKRRRDGIILGCFVAFCVLMLLYFR
jgi:golgi SNAP receptor complex member 1